MRHPSRSWIGAAARCRQITLGASIPLSLVSFCLIWPSLVIGGVHPFVDSKPPLLIGEDPSLRIEAFAPVVDATGISIVGPSEMDVGQTGEFYLLGTPPIDLDIPFKDQLDWAIGEHAMGAYVAVPGEPLKSLAVLLELVITLDGITTQPLVKFTPAENGEHRVVVDWNYGGNQLVEHRFQVGEGPDPPPPPPPPPDVVEFGLIIEERDNRSKLPPERVFVFESKKVRDLFPDGNFQLRDDDIEGEDIWDPYITKAREIGLPALFLMDKAGNVVWEGPVPKDVPATVKLVKEYQ